MESFGVIESSSGHFIPWKAPRGSKPDSCFFFSYFLFFWSKKKTITARYHLESSVFCQQLAEIWQLKFVFAFLIAYFTFLWPSLLRVLRYEKQSALFHVSVLLPVVLCNMNLLRSHTTESELKGYNESWAAWRWVGGEISTSIISIRSCPSFPRELSVHGAGVTAGAICGGQNQSGWCWYRLQRRDGL